MEFGNVGCHCEMIGCNQQDMLPFECEFCGDLHCSKHHRTQDHNCRNAGPMDDNFVIICPLCKARLSLNGAEANENSQASEIVWNKHVECGDCDR